MTPHQDFDFVWADKQWMADHFDGLRLQDHQRVNHFRNHYELTRKDLLIKNLKRIKKQLEKEERCATPASLSPRARIVLNQLFRHAEAAKYDFFPQSYVLPSEYMMFENAYISQPGLTWIAKPTARAQGKGIFLINDLRDVKDWKKANLPVKKKEPDPFAKPKKVKPGKEGEESAIEAGADQKKELEPYIVQRYLEDPYLVGSKKFDMRIYVLVTSYSPLTVWLYRSGFARFSGVRYSVDEKSLAAHATNVAVQKTAAGYDPETGCKWMLHSLKAFLTSRHGYEAATNVFYEIQMLILRSLLAVQRAMMNDKHCVEMCVSLFCMGAGRFFHACGVAGMVTTSFSTATSSLGSLKSMPAPASQVTRCVGGQLQGAVV
jgi:tubulin polyglutamylase TTLL9